VECGGGKASPNAKSLQKKVGGIGVERNTPTPNLFLR
jgi:hypothetical protein